MIFVKLHAHNYQHASIQIIDENYYTSMMQPRSHMAQQRVIIIHCLYLAKLNPVLCIGRIAQLVEHLTDDLESAGSSSLYANIFLLIMFACWHTSLQVETNN